MENQTYFVDAKGIRWNVTLTLAAAKRIDNSDYTAITDKPFTILDPDKDLFNLIIHSDSLSFAMLWSIVYPQALDFSKNKEDTQGFLPLENFESLEAWSLEAEANFLEGIDGEAKERGKACLWETIANFFPQQKIVLLRLIEHYQKGQKKLQEALMRQEKTMETYMTKEIDQGVIELEEEIQKQLDPKL